MNNKMKELIRPEKKQKCYNDLTFTDNFLFCKIMEKRPELCKRLLEILLNKRIKNIVYVNKEETIDVAVRSKSVRLDVYVDDEEGTVYDMEMQTTSNTNIPKRLRYYQGMIDLNMIEKGADYNELKKSFIILICTFDYFKKGLPVYTFTNRCAEKMELELGDDTTKLLVNPYSERNELTADMQAFLDYLLGKIDDDNAFVREVEKEVAASKSHEEWRVEYMGLYMRDWDNFRDGKAEGKAEDILELLIELGEIAEELQKKVLEEKDLEVLRKWHRLAARCESVTEFEEKM